MKTFDAIDLMDLDKSIIRLIGKDWMLVTAGNSGNFNTMTASWGGMGFLWNRVVAFVFIRPQRYTFEFLERESVMTLSFFDEQYRKALNICGSKSGRNVNKMELTGLTPIQSENDCVSFSEASLIIEGRKLYNDFLKPEAFIEKGIIDETYSAGDFHKMYVIEITKAWSKQTV